MRNSSYLPIAFYVFSSLVTAQERTLSPELSGGHTTPLAADADGTSLALPEIAPDQVLIRLLDGQWAMRVRVASPGAEAIQLFVENLRLPDKAVLSIYSVDSNGDAHIAAEYSKVGPLQGDPFWTTAVTGGEAFAEVRFAGEALSDMPFQLTQIRALTADGYARAIAVREEMLARPELEGKTAFASFRGATVPFEIRGGMAMFENDIVLGPAEEIQVVSSKDLNSQRQSQGITNTYYRWPGGIIPYTIDPTLPSQNRITDAVAHWNAQLAGTINFRPWSGEAHYVRFVNTSSSGTCNSYIGNLHQAGQPITIGSACGTGNVIHEMGHAVGLYHEHTRENRNSFVVINTANITSSALSNFSQAISASDDLGAYDFGSIMHYGAYSFSANGLPTITTIPEGVPIGQRNGLSAGDIAGVRMMYPAAAPAPPPVANVNVTVSSNPAGQTVLVDGVTTTAPATFSWTAGSAHTISAPGTTTGSTRYLFKNWSDGGAQAHTVTVPSTSLTLTANFQLQNKVSASSNNTALGSVTLSPVTADSFYNAGSAITVTASPSAAACLTGWSGISAPPGTPLQLTANQPYALTGNFQSAALSVSPSLITAPAAASIVFVSVSSTSGCAWRATSNVSWITITSAASGTSSASLALSIAKEPAGKARTGTVTVGKATITVNQSGVVKRTVTGGLR